MDIKDGRKLLTPCESPSTNKISVYFDREREIYDTFRNKITYFCEELDGKYLALSSGISQVDQVSLPCQKNWETYKICCERILYFEFDSTFEGKEGMEEGCSSRYEFDGEYLHVVDDFHNTPRCLERFLSPKL